LSVGTALYPQASSCN